jgi:plastocyanin
VASRSGSPNRTATPTAAGYTINNLAVGTWSLAYTPPTTHVLANGEDGSRSVAITEGQTATASAFQLDPAPVSDVVEVHLSGIAFDPATITIEPGTTVRWINDGNDAHTVTPENTSQSGVWQRQTTSSPGLVFEHTFNVPNQTYRYRCEPHSTSFTSGMVGTVTVTG